MTMPAILEVRGACKRFGGAVALDGVDLDVQHGERVGLLGPNGAGKTSLVRAIAGRVRLDAGRIALAGEPSDRTALGRRVGLAPQENALYPFLTARENLEVFGRLYGPRRTRVARARRLGARLDRPRRARGRAYGRLLWGDEAAAEPRLRRPAPAGPGPARRAHHRRRSPEPRAHLRDAGRAAARRSGAPAHDAPTRLGARTIADASPDLHRMAPQAMAKLRALRPSQPHAVLRLWMDQPSGSGLPGFVITDKKALLDSITFFHHVEESSAAWASRSGGSVLELHCYAVPDGVRESGIAETLKEELFDYLPELRRARILGEHLQVNRNFTAFHTGMRARRPAVETEDTRLVLAGDWVALPLPAMLMEAAVTSGLVAANAILRREGVREEPVYSVPLRGLLARSSCGTRCVDAQNKR